jgi:hypothetical protein
VETCPIRPEQACWAHVVAITTFKGTPVELIYSLLTFGIPTDQLPVTSTGTIKTKNHLQWMKFLKEKEEAERLGIPFDFVDCPGMNDVLFSLGRHTWCHPGYAMFRGLLETHYARHNASTSLEEKLAITWQIVEEVEQKGGRFLTRDSRGWWVRITDRNVIRAKVALAFRNQHKRVMARKNCQDDGDAVVAVDNREAKRLRIGNCCDQLE